MQTKISRLADTPTYVPLLRIEIKEIHKIDTIFLSPKSMDEF